MDARTAPHLLPAGVVSESVNFRFRDGRARTRGGLRMMAWGARHTAGYGPGDVLPYAAPSGRGIFNDPASGIGWIIIATPGGVFRSQAGTTGIQMRLPAGAVIPSRVQIIQTFDGMVMLRGRGLDPLYCRDLDVGWQELPEPSLPGRMKMPPASQGIYFQNRLFLVYEGPVTSARDSIWVSDIGGVQSVLQGSVSYNGFRINQGSKDRLVAIAAFNQSTIVAFKEDSVYYVGGIAGTNEDIANNATCDRITDEYGLRARNAIVQVGTDLWFLGHKRGVVSVRMTEQGKLQGVDVPISRDIDPWVQRINWEYADDATAAAADNYVYFAVPYLAAKTNSVAFVWDSLNGGWVSRDESDALKVLDWIRFSYGGTIALGFLSADGYVYLYDSGLFDQIGAALGKWEWKAIRAKLTSRGYFGDESGRKQFTEFNRTLRTYSARYSIRAIVDGVGEGKTVIAGASYDPTKYARPYSRARWDPTNAGDDWAEPYREDYALAVRADTLAVGTGLAPDVEQVDSRGHRLTAQGNWIQFEVSVEFGRVTVDSLRVDSSRGSPRMAFQR